ncbi:hypothetical protein BDD12DRAFT_152696 [Trichophaea hybrida]|nr:hypothetical protein BDD12DRAFT_152696 [Trichophaea hybrida]
MPCLRFNKGGASASHTCIAQSLGIYLSLSHNLLSNKCLALSLFAYLHFSAESLLPLTPFSYSTVVYRRNSPTCFKVFHPRNRRLVFKASGGGSASIAAVTKDSRSLLSGGHHTCPQESDPVGPVEPQPANFWAPHLAGSKRGSNKAVPRWEYGERARRRCVRCCEIE